MHLLFFGSFAAGMTRFLRCLDIEIMSILLDQLLRFELTYELLLIRHDMTGT